MKISGPHRKLKKQANRLLEEKYGTVKESSKKRNRYCCIPYQCVPKYRERLYATVVFNTNVARSVGTEWYVHTLWLAHLPRREAATASLLAATALMRGVSPLSSRPSITAPGSSAFARGHEQNKNKKQPTLVFGLQHFRQVLIVGYDWVRSTKYVWGSLDLDSFVYVDGVTATRTLWCIVRWQTNYW